MNINELFETIQDEFQIDEINGEFLLCDNVIIWSYNLLDNTEEINICDEDDEEFNFETLSCEELQLEAYHEDIENLKLFLDNIGEIDNFSISDNEMIDKSMVFKITL